ncbi:RidA family protein [Conexibacter sp. JD483]|uniref:RidA family protein n=1 Tax=unclassified Conexibacter TaxID=2627773 RepID=UPI00271ADC7B|nr:MULTISPECIES: RidA family protein [unclassified Conexibacter]MDO8185193.1 RidA family protein [Conexibacter sp. CPCC 205706]MDO8198239.1 RidA family protein [Conexibacter sp. CPCC 205762]MDR9367799.1 RidA family protein [Conexibacter sp. JD483]
MTSLAHLRNPWDGADADRAEIWEMLVRRDIEAYVEADWERVADDFDGGSFIAVDGAASTDPDAWRLGYPGLEEYRERWLHGAAQDVARALDPAADFAAATFLDGIELERDRALVHKRFDGPLRLQDGDVETLAWRTIYLCRRIDERWRIVGFVGFLPPRPAPAPAKRVPAGAAQHVTAGPYSPVLEVDPRRTVVISGQAAIAPDGALIGTTVREQARATLENCRAQLQTAGLDLADVFKVNVYLTDLAEWESFNEVYRELMPAPLPVRTAIGCQLLPGLLVEVELWAAAAVVA